MKIKDNLYHRYIYLKTMPITLTIADADRGKLWTLAKHAGYVTVEDYIINLIESEYNAIDATSIISVKNQRKPYDKTIHLLKPHRLEHPKLLKHKNNILDDKQTNLEKYI